MVGSDIYVRVRKRVMIGLLKERKKAGYSLQGKLLVFVVKVLMMSTC